MAVKAKNCAVQNLQRLSSIAQLLSVLNKEIIYTQPRYIANKWCYLTLSIACCAEEQS